MSNILNLVDSSLDPAGLGDVFVGMTVRVDETDKRRVDLLCGFLGVSRQRFLHSAVQDALGAVIEALGDSDAPHVGEVLAALAELDYEEDQHQQMLLSEFQP